MNGYNLLAIVRHQKPGVSGLRTEESEIIRVMAPFIVNALPNGGVLYVTDHQSFRWKVASPLFDVQSVVPGENFDPTGPEAQAIATGEMVIRRVDNGDGDLRSKVMVFPVSDGKKVTGTVVLWQKMVHPVFRALTVLAPELTRLFPEGAFMWAGDLEKMTLRFPSEKFDVSMFQIGHRHDDEKVLECIRTGKSILFNVPEEQYGLPIVSLINPVFDEEDQKTVIGVHGVILPKRASFRMRKMAETLDKNTAQMASALEELAASAGKMSDSGERLNEKVKDIFASAQNINGITGLVKQIADQTKLLGLNAAIEAARAGSVGRGFEVVATEIRKLSDESKATVNRIVDLASQIMEKLSEINEYSEAAKLSSAKQASATQEVAANIQNLAGMTQKLRRYAAEL